MDVGFSIGMFFGGPQQAESRRSPRPARHPPLPVERPRRTRPESAGFSLPQRLRPVGPGGRHHPRQGRRHRYPHVGATASTSTCASSGDDPSAFLGQCPKTNMKAESQGVTPDALLVTRCVAAAFPTITDISTYAGHEPTEAQAVDIMIPDWQTPAGQKLGHDLSRWIQSAPARAGRAVRHLVGSDLERRTEL